MSVWSLGQTSKGTIAGTVLDESGAVVINATVTVTPLAGTDNPRTDTTGNNGAFRIEALNPGMYTVTITSPNFATLKIENLEVKASTMTNANATLKIAKVSETVTVEGGTAAQLKTETAEISHNIDAKQITQLPIAGLNPVELTLTEPGVVSPGSATSNTNGTQIIVNGTRGRSNNFLLDGGDNNDSSIQGQALQSQNAEAISEVVILTNSYAAEFGRGGGSVTNEISKGGSNTFHGSAWEIYQGSALDALTPNQGRSYTDRSSKPRYDQHIYGFSFGGRIIKDKLFFFGTSQWNRFYGMAVPDTRVVPTAAGLAALNSLTEAGISTRAQEMIAATGGLIGNTALGDVVGVNIGTRPGCAANPCIVQFAKGLRTGVPQQSTDTQWQWRVDWLPTQHDTFNFSYLHDRGIFTPDFFNSPSELSTEETGQGGPGQHAAMTWTHILNNTTVNEFRAIWGYFDFQFGLVGEGSSPLAGKPLTTVADAMYFGYPSNMPQSRGHHTYQVQEAFSKSFGNHSLKLGADVWRIMIRDGIPFNSRGTIAYNGGGDCTTVGLAGECSGLLNYLQDFSGISGQADLQFGDPIVRPHTFLLAFYGQDTWKIRPNLTMDYGVRWEYQQNMENTVPYPATDISLVPFAPFPSPRQVKPDLNNWGPRIGLSYQPRFWKGLFGDNKTVLRAGYGLFYDTQFSNNLDNIAASNPNTLGGTIVGEVATNCVAAAGNNYCRGLSGFSGQFGAIAPILDPTNRQTTVPYNLVNPFTHQWNVNVQRELPWNTFAEVAYVGTRGQRLLATDQGNPGVGGVARQNPLRGAIQLRGNFADSIYHGLQTKVEHHFSHGLFLRGAYTWSKVIDNASDVFETDFNAYSRYGQDPFDRGRHAERSLSNFDIRQRLALTYVYEVPNMPKLSNGFADKLAYVARHWSFSGTSVFQAGNPDTVYLGRDNNGDFDTWNDRPDLGNPNAPLNTWAYPSSQVSSSTPGWAAGQYYNGQEWDSCRNHLSSCPAAYATNGLAALAVDPNSVHWLYPNPGQLGNVGRNTYIQPGYQVWNFSLIRSFPMPFKEGHALMFRLEMYNAFNHPTVSGVNLQMRNTFGDFFDTTSYMSGSRNIRLNLKYQF